MSGSSDRVKELALWWIRAGFYAGIHFVRQWSSRRQTARLQYADTIITIGTGARKELIVLLIMHTVIRVNRLGILRSNVWNTSDCHISNNLSIQCIWKLSSAGKKPSEGNSPTFIQ
jgi:hypothetical protein